MNRLEAVTWSVGKEGGPLTVARIRPRDFDQHAAGLLTVMGLAYDRQFGDEGTRHLPAEAAFDIFDSWTPDKRAKHLERMLRYADRGSVYWAAYASVSFEPGEDMIGVAKTSPSWPSLFRKLVDYPNCYVNDISTREARKGVGTGLLWAALSDYNDDRIVVADALPGSEGFLRAVDLSEGDRIDDLELGDFRLPLVRFQAAVQGVRAALEANAPWLADRSVRTS